MKVERLEHAGEVGLASKTQRPVKVTDQNFVQRLNGVLSPDKTSDAREATASQPPSAQRSGHRIEQDLTAFLSTEELQFSAEVLKLDEQARNALFIKRLQNVHLRDVGEQVDYYA